MLGNIAQFFKEPPVKETIQDPEKVKSMYSHWRLRIFYACFIGYTIFYLCKKNNLHFFFLLNKIKHLLHFY